MASITKDELKSRVTQPTSRLAVPGAKVEEPARPVETTLSAAKNRVSDFTKKAGKKSGVSPDIVNVDAKEYRPEDLRKAMFTKARTYYSMPDELKPIAQQGFVKAYSAYESAKSDPMSPLYNPYSRPTNYKAIDGLAQYGYDVSKMTEDEIRALTAYRRTTATGYGAAAPTKSSTAAENAAYWAQEYLDASERTAAAESELAAMQKAVDYYVNTLGLSDAEIVQRINTSKDYPTLAKMQEGSVTPLLMNRAIDYSGDDTVYGMIFSARNGGASMGSNDMNAGAYMGGFGNRYEDDGGVARRNAGDLNTYNPYAGGTTLEALGLKYGTGSFTAEWLADNRDRLAVEAPDDLKKIDAAIATSTEAEKEYAELREWAQKRIAAGDTPEEIKEKLDEELGDKDYSTLAKMEEGRRTGNPIAMGYGVGFARSEFERYIDSLYAEANAEAQAETAPQFTVSSYYERGGDGNILNNEVSNWLTGRAPTTEEGKAFIDEYGWLLSGYTQDRGTETLYDRRLAERPGLFGKATGLGETAHDLLVEAQEAADNRWLSTEDYVTVAMSVAQNMEAAEAAGMSLEDYLSSGMGTLPDISDIVEQGRVEVEKKDADRRAMEAMQIQQSIEEADAAVANGTATAEQASLAASLDSMDVSEAEYMSPAIAEQRSAIRTELQEYSRSAIVGNLETVYGDMSTYGGSVREMEAADNARSVAYNTADNIADIALSYYNADANRAAVMGIDLDEYYALYPERRMSTEEAYRRAQTEYNTTWGTVWANVEKQANLARQGQMVMPQQSLSGVVSASEQADAAYDASKAPAIEYGEGVGVGQTVRSSLAGGGLEAAGGTISAIQYFVTSNNDYMAESAARMGFNNDPVAYRKHLEETVAAIADPEQRDAYEYLLKNYEGDVFNITLDTYDIAASNALHRIQQESMEIDQFMQENGTAGENAAFNFGKNAVSNSIYLAETAALTAVGLPGGVAAAAVFGAPAGADMGRKLEAAGMNTTAAKGAALGWAVTTGWLESSTLGNYIPGLAEKAGTSLVKQGLSAAFKRNPKILSNVLNWIVPSMASEAAQEGVEYLAGTAYESVFTTAAKGGGSFAEYVGQVVQDVEGDELLDNMKMGALMAPVLGVVGLGASATAKATTAVAGRIPGKRRSQEIAEQIIDNGGATAEQAMEFAEALDEDMKDPEFASEMQAAAREAQISEYVAQEVMGGALAEDVAEPAPQTSTQPSGRRAKRNAQREYRKHDVFVQQVERAQADLAKVQASKAEYAALYQDAMREYDADPSDAAMQKMVMELTTELASLNEQERAATERVAAEEAKLRDYEAELGETRLARLEEARRNAVMRVNAEEAQARAEKRAEAQPEEPQAEQPEPVYNEETVPEQPVEQTEAQPEPVSDPPVERPVQPSVDRTALDAQAQKLQKAFEKYARGKRISQEGTFSRSGKLPLELGLLEDAGLLTVQGKAALDAYANGDTDYVAEHAEYIARRLEPVLTMLAEDAKAAEANTDQRFYHGRSAAAFAAQDATQNGVNKTPYSPVRTMDELTDELHLGRYIAAPGTEARFSMRNEYMQINTLHQSDYWRKAHEIGHGLAKKLDMTATDDMANSGWFINASNEETFAEFVGVYMANRNTAVTLAGPDFVQEFERRMREAGVYKPVIKAATKIREYITASAEDKISAQIVNRSDTKRKDSEALRRYMVHMVDHAFAARKFDEKAGNTGYGLEDAMHYRNHHLNSALTCLTTRLIDPEGNTRGASFSSALASAGITAEHMDALVRYKLAQHALSRADQGTPVFGDNVTTGELREIVRSADEVVKAGGAVWDAWWDEFMRLWAVGGNIVPAEDYETWHAMYPHFVPTVRDVDGAKLDVSHSDAASGTGGWTFHAAHGSDLDIINPLDSLCEYVTGFVTRVANNTVAQKFDEMYVENEGMGEFARIVAAPATEPNHMPTTGDTIGDYIWAAGRGDTYAVRRANGEVVYYQFTDPILLEALNSTGMQGVNAFFRGTQAVVRTFSALTTGNNIAFGGKNAMRDAVKGVTYGSYALTEADGMATWARNLVRVIQDSDTDMEEYRNLGGGGWGAVNTGKPVSRAKLRKQIIENYHGESAKERVALASDTVFNVVTASKVNEVIEQTTRVAEFNSPSNRRLRNQGVEGRRKAFLNSQEVTTDFARYGTGSGYAIVKSVFPFINPSIQGLAQQADLIADAFGSDVPAADRKKAWSRIGKTATTYGIRAGLQIALLKMLFTDDEREGYDLLSDEIKGQNFIIPTRLVKGIFSDVDPERMFIRIPSAQGILDSSLYAGFLAGMSNLGNIDEASINFLDVAGRIIGDAAPIDITGIFDNSGNGNFANFAHSVTQSSIFGPIAAVAANRNWYGSAIVNTSLEGEHITRQYNETTPTVFVELSEWMHRNMNGFSVSPLALQYLAEQYTGFFGQVLIPFASRDKATEEWGWDSSARNVVRKLTSGYTIEPLYNNDVSDAYYDYGEAIGHIADTPEGGYLPGVRENADWDEAHDAAIELNEEWQDINKEVKACTKEINEINSDASMTPAERALAVREPTLERIRLMEEANTLYGEYMAEYGRQNLWERILSLGN